MELGTEDRTALAKRGIAMPDGSFPVRSTEDLDHAIRAIGRAHDPAATKQHIIRRARALGAKGALPLSWL